MTTDRAEYTAGLRALADLLDTTPDLPLPSSREITWAVHYFADTKEGGEKAALAKIARLLPGKLDKNDPNAGEYGAKYFELSGNLHGLDLRVWAERPSVCERIVTGQRQVTKTEVVEAREVTVTEDVVEWVCRPLLAEAK